MARWIKTLLHRLSTSVVEIFGLLLALPLRALAPFMRVEVQEVWAARIGHLALEPEMWLCRRAVTPEPRTFTVFYAKKPIANDFMLTMWRRVLPFGPSALLDPIYRAGGRWRWLDVRARGWDQRHFDLRALDARSPHVAFTAPERARGEQLLAELGIAPGQPFICLAVRDSAYLASTQPDRDWTYHRYRDSRIETYEPMVRRLADAGYAVLRMGAVVAEPLVTSSPGVVDYANSGLRSDFADVFLFANCAMCISSSTGMDSVAMLFRRPLILVNLPGAGGCQLGGPLRRVMFKTIIDAQTRQPLPLMDERRFQAMSFHRTDQYEKSGLELVDNSAEELLAVADEVLADVSNDWILPPASDREREFVERIPTVGRLLGAGFRVSRTWLRTSVADPEA